MSNEIELQKEINTLRMIIYDLEHGISAATKYDEWAAELMGRYWFLETSMRQLVDGEISYGRMREIVKAWIGANYGEECVRMPSVQSTPHIDRGPGFTHSDPAETCGCQFAGWECPINKPGCVKNCGNYGCGN